MKGRLPVFKIRLGGKEYTIDNEKEIDIDDANLGSELVNQPTKYAWLAVLYGLAESNLEVIEEEEKQLYAELSAGMRISSGKLTETTIKNAVLIDDRYRLMVKKRLIARKYVHILHRLVKSWEIRMQAIMALNANEREERKQYI